MLLFYHQCKCTVSKWSIFLFHAVCLTSFEIKGKMRCLALLRQWLCNSVSGKISLPLCVMDSTYKMIDDGMLLPRGKLVNIVVTYHMWFLSFWKVLVQTEILKMHIDFKNLVQKMKVKYISNKFILIIFWNDNIFYMPG